MAGQAKAAMGVEALDALADRGYFKGEEVLACEPIGVTPYVPKPLTSGAKAEGRFGKQDFIYVPENDTYRCRAGEALLCDGRARDEPALLPGRLSAKPSSSRRSGLRMAAVRMTTSSSSPSTNDHKLVEKQVRPKRALTI